MKKKHFIRLAAISTLVVPLWTYSPLVSAAYFDAEKLDQEEKIFNSNKLTTEEVPLQIWDLDISESQLSILKLLKAQKFNAALKAAQQLRKKQADTPDIFTLMGLAYAGQGHQEQAKAAFHTALKLDPGNLNAALFSAEIASQEGDFDTAKSYYQEIIKYHPGNKMGLLMLGRLEIRSQLEKKDFTTALKTAQQLHTKNPDNPDPMTLMGMAYIGKGEISQAQTAFEKALKIKPGNPNAALNLARIAVQKEDLKAAQHYYQEILKYHPDHQESSLMLARLEAQQGNQQAALLRLKTLVEQRPKDIKPLVALARFQLNNGQAAKAISILESAPKQFSEHPLRLATLGEAQLIRHDWSNAQRNFQQWLKQQPKSARAHFLIGAAYLANNKRSAAKKSLFSGLKLNPELLSGSQLMTLLVSSEPTLKGKKKLVSALKKVQPQHPQVLDLDAQLTLQDGDASKAVIIYKGLQERFPDSVVWVRALARAQWQAGKKDSHIKTLNNWLKNHPDDISTRYMLATAYIQLNRKAEAKTALTKIIAQRPNNASVLNNLAWLLRDDEPAQALAYAEHAYQLSPKAPAVLDTLGLLQLHHGDKVKAQSLLYQAQLLAPDNLTLAYHYAMALTENGQQDQARRVLNGIKNKSFPEQRQAQVLYKSLP